MLITLRMTLAICSAHRAAVETPAVSVVFCVDGVPSGTGATKGRGIPSPLMVFRQGDNLNIDYVAHEVRQLGGNHAFTHQNEGTVAQREVGGGITIMGYAGITSFDPAPHPLIFSTRHPSTRSRTTWLQNRPITTNITATNHSHRL